MWRFTCRPSTSWAEPPAPLRSVRLIRRLFLTLLGILGVVILSILASRPPATAGMADPVPVPSWERP